MTDQSPIPREAVPADVLADFYFRCCCGCDREGYIVDVVEHLTVERDAENTRLREQVAHLTKLHDERDAIERSRSVGNEVVMAGALDVLAAELRQRGNERAQIGDDDGEPDEEHDEGTCHTDAAVSTWLRAASLAERRAAALRTSPSAPAQEGSTP